MHVLLLQVGVLYMREVKLQNEKNSILLVGYLSYQNTWNISSIYVEEREK